MNRMQSQVEEFHRAMGIVVGDKPELRERVLRARLVHEEAMELVTALGCRVVDGQVVDAPDIQPDFVEAIDAMADTIYVVMGTAVSAGIDLEPFYNEVQKTNLAKLGGPVDGGGKIGKPPGWKPPQIAEILEQYIAWKRVVPEAYRRRVRFEPGRRYFQVLAEALPAMVASPWWRGEMVNEETAAEVVWMLEEHSPVFSAPFPPPTRGHRHVRCSAAIVSLVASDYANAKEYLEGSSPYDGLQVPNILVS